MTNFENYPSKQDKLDNRYQPTKEEMERDVSVSVIPHRLAQAVLKGGASRREKNKTSTNLATERAITSKKPFA